MISGAALPQPGPPRTGTGWRQRHGRVWLRCRCRLLATFNPPYHVQNDWTSLQIGVCAGPVARWNAIWPHLRHYD
jgi:hypothetical protein